MTKPNNNFCRRVLLRLIIAAVLTSMCFCVSAESQTVTVVYVVDGDTVVIDCEGSQERLRLIGIDTPESKRNTKARRDAAKRKIDIEAIVEMGLKATAFVKGIIPPGNRLVLEFDVQERDRYGRLLAYAYLPNGKMLNELIIERGYAVPMVIKPCVKYKEKFAVAYEEAVKDEVGLWVNQ